MTTREFLRVLKLTETAQSKSYIRWLMAIIIVVAGDERCPCPVGAMHAVVNHVAHGVHLQAAFARGESHDTVAGIIVASIFAA